MRKYRAVLAVSRPSKSGSRASGSWVRIPPCPPKRNDNFRKKIVVSFCSFHCSLLVFLFSLKLSFSNKRGNIRKGWFAAQSVDFNIFMTLSKQCISQKVPLKLRFSAQKVRRIFDRITSNFLHYCQKFHFMIHSVWWNEFFQGLRIWKERLY